MSKAIAKKNSQNNLVVLLGTMTNCARSAPANSTCVIAENVRGVSWSEVATVPKRKSHMGLDLDLSLNSEVNSRKGWKENGGTK